LVSVKAESKKHVRGEDWPGPANQSLMIRNLEGCEAQGGIRHEGPG
jgi:hypothetical protein